MPSIERTIRIDAEHTHVWNLLADTGAIGKWLALVDKASIDKTGLGSVRECTFVDGSSVRESFLEWDPGRRVAFTVEGDMPVVGGVARWSLVEVADGTVLEYRFTYDRIADGVADPDAALAEVNGLVDVVLESFRMYAAEGRQFQPPMPTEAA